jgi:regulatory protein
MIGREESDLADEDVGPEGVAPQEDAPTARMLSWVRNSALYRLNQKMMTEHELFTALRKKALSKFEGIAPELATRLARAGIDFCNEHRLLDDRTYAEMKTASAARSGHSRRRIARDLKTKGVEPALIETAVGELDDLASALNYARRRAFGPFRKVPLDEKRKAKEFGAFARNGYSAGVAGKVITLPLDELEALIEGG